MKKLTKLSLLALISMLTFSISSCTKDLEDRMDKVEGEVAKLVTSLSDLSTKLSEMTYIKSIAVAADGKMTITPSKGDAIIYDAAAQASSKYEIKVEGNKLMVKGPGDADFKSVGDVNSPKITVKDGELLVNGASLDPKVMFPSGSIIINKNEAGDIISVTLSDGKDSVTINVTDMTAIDNRPIEGLIFIPEYLAPLNTTYQGYINSVKETAVVGGLVENNVKVAFNTNTVNFRVNPTSVNVEGYTWNFINNQAYSRAAVSNGDSRSLYLAPENAVAMEETGSYSFELKVGIWKEASIGKKHLISLEAVNEDATNKVVSDYVVVEPIGYKVAVANTAKLAIVPALTTIASVVYEDSLPTVKDITTVADHSISYLTKDFDLKVYVKDLSFVNGETLLASAKPLVENRFEDCTFRFTNVSYIPSTGDVTNQSAFISVEGSTLNVLQGSAAIGRTPIIKVEIIAADGVSVIGFGYIKLAIKAAVSKDIEFTKTVAEPYKYNKLYVANGGTIGADTTAIRISWQEMNNIFTDLGMSQAQFKEVYATSANVEVTVAASTLTARHGAVVADFVIAANDATVGTVAYTYYVTPKAVFGANKVIFTIKPIGANATTYKPIVITYNYVVEKPVLPIEILSGYQAGDKLTAGIKGNIPTGGIFAMQAPLGEAFQYGGINKLDTMFNSVAAAQNNIYRIRNATHRFALNQPTAKGLKIANAAITVAGDGTTPNTLALTMGVNDGTPGPIIGLSDTLKTATRDYKMAFITEYENTETDTFKYTVRFINPLTFISSIETIELLDKSEGDTLTLKTKFNVYVKNEGLIIKGINGDGTMIEGVQTVNAAKYFTESTATEGLLYTITQDQGYSVLNKWTASIPITPDTKNSVIQWKNAGTGIFTRTRVGSATVKIVTPFAEAEKVLPVFVSPVPSGPVI